MRYYAWQNEHLKKNTLHDNEGNVNIKNAVPYQKTIRLNNGGIYLDIGILSHSLYGNNR